LPSAIHSYHAIHATIRLQVIQSDAVLQNLELIPKEDGGVHFLVRGRLHLYEPELVVERVVKVLSELLDVEEQRVADATLEHSEFIAEQAFEEPANFEHVVVGDLEPSVEQH
jgi:hypothetical protein